MSFGKSVNGGGFIQKTVKEDLIIIFNHIYSPQKQLQKTLEGKPPKQRADGCQVGLVGPTYRPVGMWATLVSPSFECQCSTALGFASTPFFQVGLIRGSRIDSYPLYIAAPTPSLEKS